MLCALCSVLFWGCFFALPCAWVGTEEGCFFTFLVLTFLFFFLFWETFSLFFVVSFFCSLQCLRNGRRLDINEKHEHQNTTGEKKKRTKRTAASTKIEQQCEEKSRTRQNQEYGDHSRTRECFADDTGRAKSSTTGQHWQRSDVAWGNQSNGSIGVAGVGQRHGFRHE